MDPMSPQATALDGKAWRQGLAFWLLLLSIFTHAVVPAGAPLHRTPGSAFSATTAEVAIAPERNSAATGQAQPGAGDEGDSKGSGASDDPPFTSFAAGVPSLRLAEAATISWPALPTPRLGGGAASFSARAPPSI